MEGEGRLAGALEHKKTLSVILHVKQALDGIWFIIEYSQKKAFSVMNESYETLTFIGCRLSINY